MLLVSHEASRSGAPRVAIDIARALVTSGYDVTTVVRWDGPLRDELAAASTRLVFEPYRRTRVSLRRWQASDRFAVRIEEAAARRLLRRERPDVVYANTVKSGCYIRPALELGIPIILHAHELEPLASTTLARYDLAELYGSTHLVACSEAVATNLGRISGVPTERVNVILSSVAADEVVELAGAPLATPQTLGSGTLVVGACGRADERKGVDLWLRAAAALRANFPDVHAEFRWIGPAGDEYRALAHELGVDDVVRFAGEFANPFPELAALDVFTLPSRNDPAPLVIAEAMALAKPVVAFSVGGVADQLGGTGVLVDPGDLDTFVRSIAELLRDPDRRRDLGEAAAARSRNELGIDRLRADVVSAVVDAVRAPAQHPQDHLRYSHRGGARSPLRVVLLQSFDASALIRARDGKPELPYRVDTITDHGVDLEIVDATNRRPWTASPLKQGVSLLERVTPPALQTLLARRLVADADAVIAIFESQGNAMAMLRRLRIPPYSRRRLVVVSCWLARDLEHFGLVRRMLYRFAYRSVDRLVFFSQNQSELFARELGVEAERLVNVAYGVDHEYFAPDGRPDDGFVLAVGRDAGRDWATFLDAVRDTPFAVKVATRPRTLDHFALPANVEDLGMVDRETYRSLLARARVVVVPSQDLRYPTGQSVTLEAMAMGKCCVVTGIASMREYVDDDVNALVVAPTDSLSLRRAITRAHGDAALRDRIGAEARRSVEQRFNAALMWRRIADITRDACHA